MGNVPNKPANEEAVAEFQPRDARDYELVERLRDVEGELRNMRQRHEEEQRRLRDHVIWQDIQRHKEDVQRILNHNADMQNMRQRHEEALNFFKAMCILLAVIVIGMMNK